MSEWREKESLIESKIEDCEIAREKQEVINATQSSWNHSTEKRIDKLSENQTKFMITIAALTAMVVENSDQVFKFIAGIFKP